MDEETILDTPAKQFLKRMAFGAVCVAGKKSKALCDELVEEGLAIHSDSGFYADYYIASFKGIELLLFAGFNTRSLPIPLLYMGAKE